LSFPSPGDLPDPGIELESPLLAGEFFITEPPRKYTYYDNYTTDFILFFFLLYLISLTYRILSTLRRKIKLIHGFSKGIKSFIIIQSCKLSIKIYVT